MSLPQVLFSLMLMGMLSQATISMSGLALDTQKRAEMRAKLVELSAAVLRHYDRHGNLPANLTVLDLAAPVTATELQHGLTDQYSQQFALLHRNDPAQSFTVATSTSPLVVALLAKNGNGQLDSTLAAGTLTLAGDDYAVFITRAQLEATPRWQTRQRVVTCSSALALYRSANPAPAGVEPLIASGYLHPGQALDGWGGKLLLSGSQCFSAGPDLVAGTASDNVIL